MEEKKRIVIKVGSNVLTKDDGSLDQERMALLVSQLAVLHQDGVEIILVSSGAVASGRGEISQPNKKLDAVSARQLYSAVGQAKLINIYYNLFQKYNIICGQILTTKESLSTRGDYLNQRNCMGVMLGNGVIPIVNENDTISVTELMFTDNDELSGMIATMMGAKSLIILSNIDGIYNGNPKDDKSEVIRSVGADINSVSQYISTTRSQFGRGGMLTKCRIACKVASEGVEVIIANGKRDNILVDLLLKDDDIVCTKFIPSDKNISTLKKWIAHSEGFSKGKLYVNQGAYEALISPIATSLLPIGVVSVEGEFDKDDIVSIISPSGDLIAVGRVGEDSDTARRTLGQKGLKPIVHYDYMFMNYEL